SYGKAPSMRRRVHISGASISTQSSLSLAFRLRGGDHEDSTSVKSLPIEWLPSATISALSTVKSDWYRKRLRNLRMSMPSSPNTSSYNSPLWGCSVSQLSYQAIAAPKPSSFWCRCSRSTLMVTVLSSTTGVVPGRSSCDPPQAETSATARARLTKSKGLVERGAATSEVRLPQV